MNHDPQSLVGYFVTEVGVRQAWPFVTFTSNNASLTPAELRLYIDTTCDVSPPPSLVLDLAADEPAAALPALLEVLNGTVTYAAVTATADLILSFDGGTTLRVSGAPSAWTTHDVWWLGNPHA
ncbi:hypothetical protein [Micromonospora sp. CA-244673]|uniref:hypothetical protein n=1 Tax=Micromonospora sp. CA-244673 TaxID=3239958 RepID=UPI003D8F461C